MTPEALRVAIERSLLPVFAVLLVLAVVNAVATRRFPDSVSSRPENAPEAESAAV